MSATLTSVTKGKKVELLMMAKLLEAGFSVFQAVSDTVGIDCGVLGPNGHFWPIQIKSRAEFTQGDVVTVWGSGGDLPSDMFVVVYDELEKDYWVIPADIYKDLSFPKILHWKDGSFGYRLAMTKKRKTALERYRTEEGMAMLRKRVYA